MDREHKRAADGSWEEPADSRADREPAGSPEGSARQTNPPAETVEGLRAEITRLREETERNWQQFLRAAADLENYRKQAARQREEAVASTRRALLEVILGVVDSLERAIEHADGKDDADARGAADRGAAAAIVDGIRLTHRHVLDVLRTMGVCPMETVGTPFDPRFHEAVEAVRTETHAPGTIIGEVRRGYMLGDEVLRPARVRVAQ